MVLPLACPVHPVPAPAVGGGGGDGVAQKPQADIDQHPDRGDRVGLADGDHQHSGHVVGAVAVLGARRAEEGVLEGPMSIGHRHQVVEDGRGHQHGRCHTNASCAATRSSATCRY